MACYKLLREINQEAQNPRGIQNSRSYRLRRIAGASATIAQIMALFALKRCFFPIRSFQTEGILAPVPTGP
jgi:hypothetical protein